MEQMVKDADKVPNMVENFMSAMGTMLEQAKDFSLEQLPLVAKEILRYNLALDLIWVFIGIALLAGTIVAIIRINKFIGNTEDMMEKWFGLYFIPVIPTLVAILILVNNVPDLLKVWLAPRVFLLEYIAHILRH